MCSKRRNIYSTALLLFLSFVAACSRHRVVGALLSSERTSISEHWTGIRLAQPAIAKWDVQLIYLTVSPKFRPSFAPLGMQLEDGSINVPEVELISGSGQAQRFRLEGLINGEQLVYRNDQIDRKSTFSEVRIRSQQPIICSQIDWISYMPQDTKNGIP